MKKFLTFSEKKAFLIFPEMEPCTFRPRPPKFFPKKFLIFFPKNLLSKKPRIFWKRKPRKSLYIPYTSGNGTLLYFRKGVFRTPAYLKLEAYSEKLEASSEPWHI